MFSAIVIFAAAAGVMLGGALIRQFNLQVCFTFHLNDKL